MSELTKCIEALLRALVVEELTKVLPLHQSPQAALRCDYDCSHCHDDDADSPVHEYASNTGLALCVDPFCDMGVHAEHDPEPQAVGRPEAPIELGELIARTLSSNYCNECLHSWSRHGEFGDRCNVRTGGARCECRRVKQ